MRTTVTRFHDFCFGHRILGEGKCTRLHGHNARVTFYVENWGGVSPDGHAVDFSVIKDRLCSWLEDNWDHRMLLNIKDPLGFLTAVGMMNSQQLETDLGIVWLPFNPTTENLAAYLLNTVCPEQMRGTPFHVTMVDFQETRKCGVTVSTE